MKKCNLLPETDIQGTRSYVGTCNSRDFYKGTSFKMVGEWSSDTHYFNNEYVIDFVSYKGALLSCAKSHLSSSVNTPVLTKDGDKITGIQPNEYWSFVMSGIEGPAGKVWVPKVADGNLT